MNNQWGRTGSGPAASGGGIGGILFASVVSLALGAAGGYGAFRMMDDAAPTDAIELRDQRIADLAKELDARTAQIEESSQKAQSLSEKNGALERQVAALRNDAGTSDAAAALAENVRLNQQVVPELRSELELSSQLVADAQALKKRAEEAVRDRDRQLSLRRDEIARLEKALNEARSQQNMAQSAETERQAAEAALRRELEEAQRAKDAIQTTDLPALRDEIARKDREIAALTARNASLTERIAALESAARVATVPSEPEDGGDKQVIDNQKPAQGRNPRSAVVVALAIDTAPGLDRLSSVQREQLEQTLISGECVTKALNGALKRVPVLALRNLMRDLDSDC